MSPTDKAIEQIGELIRTGALTPGALADRWEVLDRRPPGKTVLVEIDLPGWCSLMRRLPERRAPKRRG